LKKIILEVLKENEVLAPFHLSVDRNSKHDEYWLSVYLPCE